MLLIKTQVKYKKKTCILQTILFSLKSVGLVFISSHMTIN